MRQSPHDQISMKGYDTNKNIKDEGVNRYKTSNEELRRENEALQQENSRLQQVLQEVTAVNKRWQRYNNDRRMYVQKLLGTIQELQEQMNQQGETALLRPTSAPPASSDELDRLRKQHDEHTQLLRLQIKSHKDDWQVERREKNKAVEEKEALAGEVEKLKEEVMHLQGLVQVQVQAPCSCRVAAKSPSPLHPHSSPHIASQLFTPRTAYQASFQVPYSPTEEMSTASSGDSKSCTFNIVEEEDCASSNYEQRCREGNERGKSEHLARNLYFGFPSEDRLASICAFSTPSECFNVMQPEDGTSKQPTETIICPNCQRSFPPAIHSCFPDHFEFCHNTDTSRKQS